MRAMTSSALYLLLSISLLHHRTSCQSAKEPESGGVNLDIHDISDLDPVSFRLSGPGLDPRAVLPVRYVVIQLVDTQGQLVTRSRGAKLIQAHLHTADNERTPVRVWEEILDLGDGSYVIRFRFVHSLPEQDVQLRLKLRDGRPIGAGSFYLAAPLYSEDCFCQQGDLAAFLNTVLKCPATYKQLDADFAQFPATLKPAKKMQERFEKEVANKNPHGVAACRYVVLFGVGDGNALYRKCFGEHVGFRMFSDHALLSLMRKTRLPPLDFVMNLGDWPLIMKSKPQTADIPVVSWCGSQDTTDIVLPTYETMEWVLDMMTRVSLDVFTTLSSSHASAHWTTKEEKAFWRGRDSSQERLALVKYSLAHPNFVDARLTNMFFFPNDSSVGERSPHVPFLDFFKYRYLPQLDGTVAAYRMPLLMGGNSTILKQESKYYEHFYADLKPFQHYLPLKSDLSDLAERLSWARSHSRDSQRVAKQAREFVKTNLMPTDILCYYGRVLQRLSRLLPLNSDLDEASELEASGFERVTESENASPPENCKCVTRNDHYHTSGILRDEL